jgi:hypothetical protein
MKTKTLILTATLSLAGLVSSQAQVFSSNAVGYVNLTIESVGWTAFTNPLNASDNSIGALFSGVELPDATSLQKWDADLGLFVGATYSVIEGFPELSGWDNPNLIMNPGEGAFIGNTSGAPIVVTFVGEVLQFDDSNMDLPVGFSMVGSKVPTDGTLESLGLADNFGADQDATSVQLWDSTLQSYVGSTYGYIDGFPEFTGFDNDLEIKVGTSFFVQIPPGGATTWDRDFDVNAIN